MEWITAEEIDNWTNRESRRAQEIVPLLVWKLILASGKSINDHHFPYGKAIQYAGVDGFLDTCDSSPFYPSGKSVWEIGTDKNIIKKFNGDYNKRSNEQNKFNLSETTFCFVTSRIWYHECGIAEFTTEKKKDSKWKDIRILDANSLALWLNECPSVKVWFQSIIGKSYSDLQTIEGYWKSIVNNTNPKLNKDFFTYNRQSILENVISQIDSNVKNIALVGNSALEVRLLFIAELLNQDNLIYEKFVNRCLIVHSQTALDKIDDEFQNMILIPTFQPSSSKFRNNQNIWIISVCRFDPLDLISKKENRIEIPQRSRQEFCNALEKLGYENRIAYEMGIDLRCSFPALFRRICTDFNKKIPEWNKKENSSDIIPALFAGTWEEKNEGDKEVISILAGVSYQDYISKIHEFMSGENAPIFKIDNFYACVATSDIWDILWQKITPDIFERFKECFSKVFSESDPKYDLSEDQWTFAEILGKKASYSRQLKDSLIVSLIMLVERSDNGSLFSSNIKNECLNLVRKDFKCFNTIEHWRTMAHYIPIFIEATPDEVLKIFEEEIKHSESHIWELFKQPHNIFSSPLYTYILWALEKTIWEREYATRALKILIIIAEKQYDYELSNSPLNTLYSIFCFWFPQCIFNKEERKILLKDIIRNHHLIAPKLVNLLLQNSTQFTSDIANPKWRNISIDKKIIAESEVSEMKIFIAETYMENILPCYEDWVIVFDNIYSYGKPTDILEKFKLQSIDMNENDKLKLCEEISKHISNHRKYKNCECQWIIDLENLYFNILPNSPKSYAHYFQYGFHGLNPLPHNDCKYDYTAERNCLMNFQIEKIQEMINSYGINSVIEILPQIQDKIAYSDVIVKCVMNNTFNWEYIKEIKKYNEDIASLVIRSLYNNDIFDVTMIGVYNIDEIDAGWILSCLPISKEFTNYIEAIGSEACSKVYWENVEVILLDNNDKEWTDKTIKYLLKYSRPYTLIDCLAYSQWNNYELIIKILWDALNKYPEPEAKGMTLKSVRNNDIEQMFLKLYSNDDVNEIEIANLELAYLQIFSSEYDPKYLINQFFNSPEMYVELISLAYKSDDVDDQSSDFEKYDENLVQKAHAVIEKINRIPGFNKENKELNENIFSKWIKDVFELSKDRGYSLANDIVMGKILSYAPTGKDGVWPAECVRDVFEGDHTDVLERNFICGKYNQRGVHFFTGGIDEDLLADRYSMDADQIQLLYPCTAAILRRISNDYRSDADRERNDELKGKY